MKHKLLLPYLKKYTDSQSGYADQVTFFKHLVLLESDPGLLPAPVQEGCLVYYVCGFPVNYRPSKLRLKYDTFGDEDDTIHSSTLRGYLCALQRVLPKDIEMRDLNMFRIDALMRMIDNKIREAQLRFPSW